jgi:hypothetical protein
MAYAEHAASDVARHATILLGDWIDSPGGYVSGPERALMAALLFDGVITCLNYAGDSSALGKKRFKEALGWVCNPGAEYIFSFENVCECLGLNSGALRSGVLSACNSRAASVRKKSRRTF